MVHVSTTLNRMHQTSIASRASAGFPGRLSTNSSTQATTDASTTTTDTGASDFQKLFSSPPPSATTSTPAPTMVNTPPPTPESVFGASPWVTNPTGTNPDGSTYNYNPKYFATSDAAAQVAQMLGGKVVSTNELTAPGSIFVQNQPNMMVQMPDGRQINAGLVANLYDHGYPQSYINTQIASIVNGTNS